MCTRSLWAVLWWMAQASVHAALPPTIVVQPSSQAATIASNVVFTVSASGSTPLHYQWALNGGELADQTNTSLTLTALKTSDGGDYAVVITNSAGSVTSRVARLDLVSGY